MTCAYAVRVALMKIPGVESAEVSLNKGLATVKLKPGNTVRPIQFWEAIRKNGNTPKATRVTVRGEVVGGTRFQVSGTGEVFEIQAASAMRQQLQGVIGKTVSVEGTLTPEKDAKRAVPLEILAVHPSR